MAHFKWANEFHEQPDGVAILNPVSVVFANTYMVTFEKTSFNCITKKSTIWNRYLDDTFWYALMEMNLLLPF